MRFRMRGGGRVAIATAWLLTLCGINSLYLHTTDADVAHAQQQNGLGGAGTVPFGRIGKTGPHHEPGVRLGASKALTDFSSLVVSYTFFESDSIDSLAPPVIPGGGGAVGSLVHHPGAAITASVGPVNAAYDVDFELADIEYRAIWKAGGCYAINCKAGLSWTGAERKWRASAGYLVSFWFNTVTTSEFINTVQANSYDNVDDTLKFEGLTARIERRW